MINARPTSIGAAAPIDEPDVMVDYENLGKLGLSFIYTGADISEFAVKDCIERLQKEEDRILLWNIEEQPIEELERMKGSFDLVTARHVINHCEYYENPLEQYEDILELFYLQEGEYVWKIVKDDPSMLDQNAANNYVHDKNQNSFSVKVRHFTIYGIFPAGWPAAANLDNLVVYPSPYIPYDGDQTNGEKGTAAEGIRIGNLPANSDITIYDIQGKKIDAVSQTGNTGLAVWDCKNSVGKEVMSGVYIIVVRGAGKTVVKKVSIIR